jgi:hypothetical protein
MGATSMLGHLGAVERLARFELCDFILGRMQLRLHVPKGGLMLVIIQ